MLFITNLVFFIGAEQTCMMPFLYHKESDARSVVLLKTSAGLLYCTYFIIDHLK